MAKKIYINSDEQYSKFKTKVKNFSEYYSGKSSDKLEIDLISLKFENKKCALILSVMGFFFIGAFRFILKLALLYYGLELFWWFVFALVFVFILFPIFLLYNLLETYKKITIIEHLIKKEIEFKNINEEKAK